MKLYLGVTDNRWYNYLSTINPEDVNFWQPGGSATFKVLNPGAPFLFKLKSPLNAIGGVGFFSSHTFLPVSVAWETFGNRNGCKSFDEFRRMILNYRSDKENVNPTIGCIVLTNPIFFKKEDWIEIPQNWSNSIVQGKSYSTDEAIGAAIWDKLNLLLQKYFSAQDFEGQKSQLILEEPEGTAYGFSILQKVRLGQGAFRVLVTDSYSRRCSITGEKTLPVLEAAHIKPYAESGPHYISNGILLRSDMHKLFDSGYLTVTNDLTVEVSKRIKEEFENGKEYYQYHGKSLLYLPSRDSDKPATKYLEWHNDNIYKQ
jgi:putative restriction endonuclease